MSDSPPVGPVVAIDLERHEGLVHVIFPSLTDRLIFTPAKGRALAAAILLMCGKEDSDDR